MSEESNLLSRISQLAGRINLRKVQSSNAPGLSTTVSGSKPFAIPPATSLSAHSWPLKVGRTRAGRISKPAHRHRSLVLKRLSNETGAEEEVAASDNGLPNNDAKHEDDNQSQWISKRDRHSQIINTSVYEKQMASRVSAMDKTRREQDLRRQYHEKRKIGKFLGLDNNTQHPTSPVPQSKHHYVTVNGLQLQVCDGGSKLARTKDTIGKTPRTAVVGGVTFYRSKNGNLYRAGLARAKRWAEDYHLLITSTNEVRLMRVRNMPVAKIMEPCRRFTTTGQCSKGPRCPYIHDPGKTAICREYLQTGACAAGDYCDLSHDSTYERVPCCLHFLRGYCSKHDCRYPHVQVNPGPSVCRPFAELGFCEKGTDCSDRHIVECPDYANSGSCGNKKCHLPHVDRAGKLRQNALSNQPAKEADDEDSTTDLSSNEDSASSDGDDIDSDDMDAEMVDASHESLSQQSDFVKL